MVFYLDHQNWALSLEQILGPLEHGEFVTLNIYLDKSDVSKIEVI